MQLRKRRFKHQSMTMSYVIGACVLLCLAVRGSVEGGGCSAEGGGGGPGEFWEVRTRGGVVRGRRATAGYYSFFGIPYGAPPTGDYRFKPPRPAAPWEGVLAADERRLCPQPPTDYSAAPLGQEDCLTLDVFAPAPAPAAPRAVLVNLHGGGFLFDTRPVTTEAVRYLLHQDVIVVTINFRVGVLGFLCLGTEAAPGNAGLRDMILALRWVRANIAAFGGDPSRVGVAGHSAGAYAAHLLALAPAAAGLFHVAFCSDGTALGDKVLMTYPLTTARKYAERLGYESVDVADLTEFYKGVSVDRILNQSLNFFNLDNGELGFSPCVERPVPGVVPVIAQAPARSLSLNSRPIMFTYCDDEGSTRAADLIKNNRKYNTDFPAFMPANLDFPSDEVKYAVSNETRTFYFGNKTITEDLALEFSNFWGDRQFVYPAVFCASEYARLGVQSHLLEFTYVGKLAAKKDPPAVPGAGHTDFFNYLMPPTEMVDESDLRVVEEITSIVANFVKTGLARASAPWPGAAPSLERVARLRVGNVTTAPVVSALPERLAFWDRLYRRYRREDYTPLLADDDY